ncbi:MAG: carbon-nitrogen hydrolase family protein, partial [Candidatus Bathyarchaeota archaeon]
KIKIALAQIRCKLADKRENIRKIESKVTQAKQQGADLIIFPELTLTGYTLRDQIYDMAETIPGVSTTAIERISKKTDTHIVFGMPELSTKTLATIYNTAVLVGPKGIIGKYQKMYLPTHSVFEEKRYFRPGYHTAVFETKLGKIGLIICYDVFFPEVSRLARLEGAQMIICISASPATRRNFFETLTVARAIENTIFFVYVNLVGVENGLQFWGGSRLIGPNGDTIVKAKYHEEDLIVREIDYVDIRPTEAFVPLMKDLRPELFAELRELAENL